MHWFIGSAGALVQLVHWFTGSADACTGTLVHWCVHQFTGSAGALVLDGLMHWFTSSAACMVHWFCMD